MKMNSRMAKYCLVLAITFAALTVPFVGRTYAQSAASTAAVKIEPREQKLDSKLMARQMPYRIILPPRYDDKANAGMRYPVIYLLHGLTGHYTNWTDKTKLADYVAGHNFIIVKPEGNDGWYTDSISVANDQYESYISQERIPEIDKKVRKRADR